MSDGLQISCKTEGGGQTRLSQKPKFEGFLLLKPSLISVKWEGVHCLEDCQEADLQQHWEKGKGCHKEGGKGLVLNIPLIGTGYSHVQMLFGRALKDTLLTSQRYLWYNTHAQRIGKILTFWEPLFGGQWPSKWPQKSWQPKKNYIQNANHS